MKKIIMTIAVLAGITATAQVKIGNNPNTLSNATSNLEVEGTTTAEQFVVLKNGNVGIGTTTPSRNLELFKDANAGVTLGITNANTGTSAFVQAVLNADGFSGGGVLQGFGKNWTTPVTNPHLEQGSLLLNNNSLGATQNNLGLSSVYGSVKIWTNKLERMTILNNGNVGIGTTAPAAPLHVSGSSGLINSIISNDLVTGFSMVAVGNTTVFGKRLYMDFFNDSYTTAGMYEANRAAVFAGSQSAGLNLGAGSATGNIRFYSGGDATTNLRMTIESNGNVSIVNTPTITTATKVLVKEPVTNIISEQVVNGNSVSTTAVAAGTTIQAVVGGNTEHTLAGAGVIMVSPNGDKWKVSVGNGGVLTIVKAL